MQFFSFTNSFSNRKNIFRFLKKKMKFQNFECQSFNKQVNYRSKFDKLSLTYLNCLPNSNFLKKPSLYGLDLNENLLFLNFQFKKSKFSLKAQALTNNSFENLEVNQIKKKTNSSWKKSAAIFYYLLDAYKKTLRAKIHSYFQSSLNFQFLLAASPFIAYFIQISLQQYNFQNQQNTFFQKTLPGVSFSIPQITWETFAYSRYANKINKDFILQVNSLNDGFFIYLNSNWHFSQKQLSTATFFTPNSSLKWSFLPSRYFYQFLTEKEKKIFQQIFLKKSSFLTSNIQKLNFFEINNRLQVFFNEFDDIPIKLNSVFLEPSHLIAIQNQIQSSLPTESFSSKIFENDLTFKTSFSTWSEFNSLFSNFFLNYQKSTLKCQSDSKEKFLVKNQSLQEVLDKLTDFKCWTTNFKTKEKKSKVAFLTLNSQKILAEKNGTQSLNSFLKQDLIGVYNKKTLAKVFNLYNSNLEKPKVLTNLKPSNTLNFDSKSMHKWATFLNEIFLKEIQKKDFYYQRNFQYTTKLGFFQFGKIIQKSLYVSQKPGAPSVWQKVIDRDLRKSFPNWINELVSQKNLPAQQLFLQAKKVFKNFGDDVASPSEQLRWDDLSFRCGDLEKKTLNFSLLKANSFETFLTKSLLTNKKLSPLLIQNPDFSFQFLKTFPVGKTEKSRSQFKTITNLSKLTFLKENSSPFYFQRKVSGYLYPDKLKSSFLKNPNLFKINLKHCFSIRKKNFLAESYYQGFLEIISPNLSAQKHLNFPAASLVFPSHKNCGTELVFKNFFCCAKSFVQGTKVASPKLLSRQDFGLQKSAPKYSLIQVYQPLIQKKGIASFLNFFSQSQFSENLNFKKKFKVQNYLNRLQPDKALTTRKHFFFGVPKKSPVYGLTFENYKEKYVNDSKVKSIKKSFRKSKLKSKVKFIKKSFQKYEFINYRKQLPKSSLIFPYRNSHNFLIKSNQKMLKKKFFSNIFQFNFTSKTILNELSKDLTFSNSSLEKKNFLTFCSITLPKFSEEFAKEQSVIPYKTVAHYTKSKTLSFIKTNFLNSTEKTFPKIKITVSNSIFESFRQILKKPSFAINLYEPIHLKSWSILSQLGFLFILFKLSKITQKEYTEEILFYVDEFYAFLNDYEKSLLDILIPEEKIRVIQKQKIKFQNVVGGEFFLTEFGEVIVLLRNSRKKFFKCQIQKPKLVKLNRLYLSVFSNLQVKQILRLPWQKFTSVFNQNKRLLKFSNLKSTFLFNQKLFDVLTEKKTNLKFENFIPKGILLVGPPGTGKTLFVKAFAGETEVPIIVESGKTLSTNKETSGAERLKDLFQAAQKMSPCILFFDEIDTIGQKRDNVISTSMIPEVKSQSPNTLKQIYLKFSFSQQELASSFFENSKDSSWDILNPVLSIQAKLDLTQSQVQKQTDLKIQLTNEKRLAGEKQNRDLAMLTQLLYELDGLTKKQEIIVIGATNRPATLDSALTRPGRFGKIIYLDLPGKQKRFELLKFYSHSKSKSFILAEKQTLKFRWSFIFDFLLPQLSVLSNLNYLKFLHKSKFEKIKSLIFLPLVSKTPLGAVLTKKAKKSTWNFKLVRHYVFPVSNLVTWNKNPQSLKVDPSVDWNYFANQTLGLSSAHLSAVMNRSAFKVIFSYLSKEEKHKNFEKFFFKRFEVKNKLNQVLSKKKNLSINESFYPKIFFEKTTVIEKFKNYKLTIFLDSTTGSPQVFKQLFLIYNFDLNQKQLFLKETEKNIQKHLNEKLNQQFSHTFESVEYGVQTIMTTISRPQLKFQKAKQFTQKLMGQLVFDDLIEKNFQNENLNSFLKRKNFFEKHRCYLRTLAFLKSFTFNFSYQKTKKKKLLKKTIFKSLTFAKLKVLKRYITRIIQNNSFGWVILFNSTCLFQNSLFLFSFQKQNRKSLSDIYYNILFFEKLTLKTCFQTLLKWQNLNEKCQKLLFGDSFFLTRSVYYLSGKAIIHFSNDQKKQPDPSIHLWSFLGYYQTRQKKPGIENAFLTKIQFENFILSLVAGKAAETLMLANQKVLCKKENFSNIGFEEIQKVGFFLQLMHNKYLFYSQKALTRKQINLILVENKKQINQEEFLFLKELAPLFEIHNKTLGFSSISHFFQKQNQFRSVEQPWWQFETLNLLSSSNLKYAQWYRLLIAEEQQNFRNIEWVTSDNYFHIQTNNFSLISNQNSFFKTKTVSFKKNFFEKKNLAFKYFHFSKLNWNQLQLYDLNFKISYFLFESFNKVFLLLEKNRELVDFLAYSLVCNEKKRPFEILNIHKRFFK